MKIWINDLISIAQSDFLPLKRMAIGPLIKKISTAKQNKVENRKEL